MNDTNAFEHDYADLAEVRLHYARRGDGPLVLFVHGFPEFWYAWRRQLAEFGGARTAVALDTRGVNLSSRPAGVEAYKIDRLVADLAGLIGHLGHARASVVGHDWGGVIAWALAIARPELVDKLVIVNAPHPGVFARLMRDDPAQQKASGYMLLFRAEGAAKMMLADGCAALREATLGSRVEAGHFGEADVAAYLEAWRKPGALDAALNYYRAMRLGPDPKDAAPAGPEALAAESVTVGVPTLVIWGMADTYLLPQNLEGLEDFVPDLRVHRIAGASHWVIHERADEVNAAIRDFLDGRI